MDNSTLNKHVDQVICRCCGEKKVKTHSKVDKTGRTIWKDEFGNRWYGIKCPTCYKKYKLQYDSERRIKLGYRPHGSIDTCKCGNRYVIRVGVKKNCPKCSGEMIKKIAAKAREENNL